MSKNIPSLENKKPFHRRNGSGDLDVFEAARYFSGANENFVDANIHHLRQKHCLRDQGVGRLSLDMPNYHRRNSIPLQDMMVENPSMVMNKKEKKHKQPSSPGGKLAHFLNSLFNQSSSKKKSKSTTTTTTQSIKDDEESPSGWRRKRRSSISLFRSGNSNNPTSVSGFPPCHTAETPTKSSASEITKVPIYENHKKNEAFNGKSGFSEKEKGFLEKANNGKHDDDDHGCDPQGFKNFIDDDYGDSDSSSDLFELTNCDLGYNSSGLPVFETTHMESMKRGAPITS